MYYFKMKIKRGSSMDLQKIMSKLKHLGILN